nr:hypothetical protein [Tanacetum cinerariifolium]
AIHKELGDSLMRTATTGSSLEAEQDSGNINKTQSKVTPNESGSQGTNLGGGLGCQETMRDTTAQTRMVKKLEKKNRSRTHRLKTLYKVGLTARVESSNNKESLDGEEVFVAEQEVVKDVNDEVNVVEEVVEEKGVDIQELGKSTLIKSSQQSHETCKGILIEPVKPMKRKNQIMFDEEAALKLQAAFDKEERCARKKVKKLEEANIPLIETWDDIQAKIDADH